MKSNLSTKSTEGKFFVANLNSRLPYQYRARENQGGFDPCMKISASSIIIIREIELDNKFRTRKSTCSASPKGVLNLLFQVTSQNFSVY